MTEKQRKALQEEIAKRKQDMSEEDAQLIKEAKELGIDVDKVKSENSKQFEDKLFLTKHKPFRPLLFIILLLFGIIPGIIYLAVWSYGNAKRAVYRGAIKGARAGAKLAKSRESKEQKAQGRFGVIRNAKALLTTEIILAVLIVIAIAVGVLCIRITVSTGILGNRSDGNAFYKYVGKTPTPIILILMMITSALLIAALIVIELKNYRKKALWVTMLSLTIFANLIAITFFILFFSNII